MGWVEEHRWEVTKLHVLASVEALKAKGATKFGCLGFCWGAAMAMQVCLGFGGGEGEGRLTWQGSKADAKMTSAEAWRRWSAGLQAEMGGGIQGVRRMQ